MKFNIISSGSKGNATIVRYKETNILIDMGISLTRLEDGLKMFNLTVKDIDAAIFTHDHADHISGLKFLSPKIQYALEGTLPTNSNVVHLFEPFIVKDIKITPFPTSHDAKNPCGYILEAGNEKLTYVTDTGFFPEESEEIAENPTYLIIESNHDIKMLLHTNRTYELKARIMSNVGHLCNEDSAIATVRLIGDRTKEIYLAHLSEEANTPEVALSAYYKIFKHFNVNIDDYLLKCANQWECTLGGNLDED
ncbi:MAG: MBL fold metallo-hydrolase [Bacilli bacterium]|nr:MBL fold metallo-hydrolase [Bacilli bacterium]